MSILLRSVPGGTNSKCAEERWLCHEVQPYVNEIHEELRVFA